MPSCQCQGIEREFSEAYVARELSRYRRKGASRSTRMLVEALKAERVNPLLGNFVELAPQLEPHDVVTLDRVICCYDDMQGLVSSSSDKAKRLYGLVLPRETWWMRLGTWLLNAGMRLRRSPFRTYVHSTRRLQAMLEGMGFTQRFFDRTLIWQVRIYAR